MKAALWAPALNRAPIETALRSVTGLDLVSAGDEAELLAALRDAETLIIPQQFLSRVQDRLRDGAPRLRWIQLLTAGSDALRANAIPAGVRLTTASDGLAPTVAEHAVALLLALGRRLHVAGANQGASRWDQKLKEDMVSLGGATLAIIGFGGIGRAVAERGRAFGATIIGVSRRALPSPLADEVRPVGGLDAVLARADAAVLALPGSPETRHIIDARRLALAKPGMLLVNVGRGATIDTPALVDALRSGRIGGAGLDVVDPEPLPADHPLWTCPNVILTPHVAAGGGYGRLARFVADRIRLSLTAPADAAG